MPVTRASVESRESDITHTQQTSDSDAINQNDIEPAMLRVDHHNISRNKKTRILSQEMLTQRMKARHSVDVAGSDSTCVWSVSSAKHGNGVSNLLQVNDLDTFWQSDGNLPHTVRIQFAQLTAIETVCVYLNFAKDESYTPRVIKVNAGTFEGDMTEVASAKVEQPNGWVMLELNSEITSSSSTMNCQKLIEQLLKQHNVSSTTREHADDAQLHKERSNLSLWLSRINEETAQRAFDADQRVWATQLEIIFTENHQLGRDCHVRGIRVLNTNDIKPFISSMLAQHMTIR